MESTLLSYQHNTTLRATYKVGSVRPQTLFVSCKEIWIPGRSGKFLLVESGILVFGIRNTAQGIQNPTNHWNSESKSHWQGLKFSTWISGIWNPESVLDSTWGALIRKSKTKTKFCEPARLSTPPKPLFSLKPLDATTWLRSLLSEVFHLIHETRHLYKLLRTDGIKIWLSKLGSHGNVNVDDNLKMSPDRTSR